jgi:hypothetical protein
LVVAVAGTIWCHLGLCQNRDDHQPAWLDKLLPLLLLVVVLLPWLLLLLLLPIN